MFAFTRVVAASILMAATASAYNNTVKTVTVTSWSTIDLCPPQKTVTICDTQCAVPTSTAAGNIVYQTLSACQAGQVITIGGTATTLAQPTTLAIEKTISDLVLVPGSAAGNDYTATVIIGSAVYSPSMIGSSGQVVTCQTGVTSLTSNGVVLTDCPCTAQTTIFEITATSGGAVPTAVVPSSNYIVKIIYVYVVEYIVNQTPTAITATVTNTLTSTQTSTQTETVAVTTATITNTINPTLIETVTTTISATTPAAPRPTIVTLGGVTFLLEYDTSYDGSASNNLRKRQAISLPGISTDLSSLDQAQLTEPKQRSGSDLCACHLQTNSVIEHCVVEFHGVKKLFDTAKFLGIIALVSVHKSLVV
ncbi:hypothetical protein E4T44_03561 [Aureobasidium sp. EXF-8845]|nr:hypothetical protein E4T44_03561 [Aureobasidium sp. EXF-8845]KAI4855450.1 hypothetical protein E4T45_03111 [Aureobasidium sp. EXF-8846]